ncbi:MAG: FHA domain-containing protein [Sumerlaeia bacterium]
MPEIIVKLGDQVVQRYKMDKDVLSIGRARDNDIVVENLSVSRNHARIRHEGGRFVLTDLNSANGSFVNGVKISKAELKDDDIISIGKHKLHFISPEMMSEKASAPQKGPAPQAPPRADGDIPALLVVLRGKQADRRFPLSRGSIAIGRANDNDIRLHDWFVSKKHAVVSFENEEFILRDLGSWRGTMVNGQPVKESKLHQSDKIMFGNTVLEFRFATPEELEKLAAMPPEQIPDNASELDELVTGLAPSHGAGADDSSISSIQAFRDGDSQRATRDVVEEDRMPSAMDLGDDIFSSEGGDDEFEPMSEEELEALESEADQDWGAPMDSEAAEWEQIQAEKMLQEGAGWTARGEKAPLVQDEKTQHADEQLLVGQGAESLIEIVDESAGQELSEIDHEEEDALFGGEVSDTEVPTASPGASSASKAEPASGAEKALAQMELPEGVDPSEVRPYLRALQNKSRVIRREAARKLKELTGIDYDWESDPK